MNAHIGTIVANAHSKSFPLLTPGQSTAIRTWLENDGRRTSMDQANGWAIKLSVVGSDATAEVNIMGSIRPPSDRIAHFHITNDARLNIYWKSGLITSLGGAPFPFIDAARRAHAIVGNWRDDQDYTLQKELIIARLVD